MSEAKITREYVVNAIESLKVFHDKAGSFLARWDGTIRADSIATREVAERAGPNSVHDAYAQGTLSMNVSADHMMACIRSVTEPALVFAAITCVRALLEASALAVWFWDHRIDGHERLRRSFAFRYDGLRQQQKLANLIGNGEMSTRVRARIEEIEKVAIKECGFDSILDSKGHRIGIGMQMPSMTDLVKVTLDREKDYRQFSAVAHAQSWACESVGFRKPSPEEQAAEFFVLERNDSTEICSQLLITASLVFVRPLWHASLLFGWDEKELTKIADSQLDVLGIKRELRPWYE